VSSGFKALAAALAIVVGLVLCCRSRDDIVHVNGVLEGTHHSQWANKPVADFEAIWSHPKHCACIVSSVTPTA
jgi:hypothetical protein